MTHKVALKPIFVRHASHAEWGAGIIVEENSSKLYLAFENGGRRAFLNEPKYREPLLRVELPSEEAAVLLAKFGLGPKPPAKKAAAAKRTRKVAKADPDPAAKQ